MDIIKFACSCKHPLFFYDIGDVKQCGLCGQNISNRAYTCERCVVWLHESCAKRLQHLPNEIIHPLIHSQHQLKLLWWHPGHFVCEKCLYLFTGSRYNCSSCDFNLEITCASSDNDQLLIVVRKKKMIQHYSHLHKLTIFKYKKIEEEDYNCSWCKNRLSDSEVCYGCLSCKFYLHELCRDEIPRTLYGHPFHPSHPLRLHHLFNYCNACGAHVLSRAPYSPAYGCQMCDFCLDFHCAKISPSLKHKCHNHFLTFFGNIPTSYVQQERFRCNACDELCGADRYRCVQCDINFHLQCVLPSSAVHRYHSHPLIFTGAIKEDDSGEYYCDVCEDERNPKDPVYCCKKCMFITHIQCVLNEDEISSENIASSSATQSMDSKSLLVREMKQNSRIDDGILSRKQLLIRLPLIHEHPLTLYEATEKQKETQFCHACRLELNGASYICTICRDELYQFYPPGRKSYIQLHEKCAKLPYEIQHPFHSAHPLNLYTRPPYNDSFTICDECRDIAFGFIYLCEECNFMLDVKCAALTAHKGGMLRLKHMERHHFAHHHKLVLGNYSDLVLQIRCNICLLPILGPAYFCPISDCGSMIFHESCLGLPQKMQVPFHPQHMMAMGDGADNRCYACGVEDILSFLYQRYNCEQCSLSLHSICANSLRRRPLECDSHMHHLYYFGTDCQLLFAKYDALFCCNECQKSCTGQPFYRCLQCAINFHLECVPIPYIVKSRYHRHPLTLKDSFVEDNSGDYFCDICEKERYPKDHVYWCEECNGFFVAHIECALAKERGESPIYQTGQEVEDSTVRSKLDCPDHESQVQGKRVKDSTVQET